MKELLPENKTPLSQAAKQALLDLGEKLDPQLLYCLQLARLQLNALPNADRADMLETLDILDGQPAPHVWRLLTEHPEDGGPYLPIATSDDPETLGETILLWLRDSLRASGVMPSRALG